MTVSRPEPADFVIRPRFRLYDLALSLGTCGLFMLMVGVRGGLIWFAVLVLHELGHFILGLRFTGRAPAIVLYPFLGLTLAPGMNRRPTPENIAFALGGIWLSAALALALLPFSRGGDVALAFLGFSLALNTINALPIPGLDGGRVCSAVFRGMPRPWPRVIGSLLFGVGIAAAWRLEDPFFWALMGLIALLTAFTLLRGGRIRTAPLPAREAAAWFAAYVLTLTVVVHLLWVVLSEPHAIFRILKGFGQA